MRDLALYLAAALCEIGGCYCFWAWLRLHKSPFWTLPGLLALIVFAITLTRIHASNAGRAYAAYGGVYIVSSLLWVWIVEKIRPDVWDCIGAITCLAGAAMILFGPRTSAP